MFLLPLFHFDHDNVLSKYPDAEGAGIKNL